MTDFELTDYGIESLLSGVVCLVAGLILSSVPNYGAVLAFAFGLVMIISSGLKLVGIWVERSERPLFWIVLLAFGLAFELGSVTDIASLLPYCLIIDAAVIVLSIVVAALQPIISAVNGFLGG